MRVTHDAQTGLRTRTVEDRGWVVTQVEQRDGTWWNIRVERKTGR